MTKPRGGRALVSLAIAAALVAVAVAPASAVDARDEDEATGYVIALDADATPEEVIDLVHAIEAGSETSLSRGADVSDVPLTPDIDVVFEQPLGDGSIGTFGVSAAAIHDMGLDAFDLSTMVDDMLQMDSNMSKAPVDATEPWDDSGFVAKERALLAELHIALSGTLSTPDRILVTTSGPAGEESLRSLVQTSDGFALEMEETVLSADQPASGAAAASSACTYFSPKSGNTSLGYSNSYPGKRYTQTYSTWSTLRVDHIASNCSSNSTFEIETHTTVVGGHFLGSYYMWYSSMPDAYKDTAFGDGDNTISGNPTKQWAIGTFELDEVVANTNYRTTMWTEPGTATTNDIFMSNGQLGVKQPFSCHSTWCVWPVDSYYLASPWTWTPGTGYWSKSSM
ncbi:MAG: hypothetical protein GY926_14400 [bacterium]|nr:hypothetical protein [bacterium]